MSTLPAPAPALAVLPALDSFLPIPHPSPAVLDTRPSEPAAAVGTARILLDLVLDLEAETGRIDLGIGKGRIVESCSWELSRLLRYRSRTALLLRHRQVHQGKETFHHQVCTSSHQFQSEEEGRM